MMQVTSKAVEHKVDINWSWCHGTFPKDLEERQRNWRSKEELRPS